MLVKLPVTLSVGSEMLPPWTPVDLPDEEAKGFLAAFAAQGAVEAEAPVDDAPLLEPLLPEKKARAKP